MSCVVAGLRYYFRIYKYEYLGELMTSKLHISVYRVLICKFCPLQKLQIRPSNLLITSKSS